MACKNICEQHKARKPADSARYLSGQKRCQVCDIFINWQGLYCPCCSYRLRTKPRGSNFRRKFRENKAKNKLKLLGVSSG